jgi:hypothetical protein
MFNKVVNLHNTQDPFLMKENEKLHQNNFHEYIFTGEFVDKASFYNIQDFDKKSKSLIRLY